MNQVTEHALPLAFNDLFGTPTNERLDSVELLLRRIITRAKRVLSGVRSISTLSVGSRAKPVFRTKRPCACKPHDSCSAVFTKLAFNHAQSRLGTIGVAQSVGGKLL